MSFSEILDITKWRLKKLVPKKMRRAWLILFALGVLCIIFRIQILKGFGNYLIYESELKKADAIFVLGGNIFDRSRKAAEIYHDGFSNKVITLGENLASITDSIPDALMSQDYLMEYGVDEQSIVPLVKGTSTREETELILNFCLENHYKEIIVVSDKFHTRRISNTFIDSFQEEGVHVMIQGVSHSSYDEEYWWKSEEGLIMVNNEYVKLMYYWWKY